MKYRVLAGQHVHSDKKEYNRGDIISTDIPLMEMFPCKFEQITPSARIDKEILKDIAPVTDKLLQEDNVSRDELESQKTPDKAQVDVSTLGKEVTMKFQEAIDQYFRVFVKERRHHVYEADNLLEPVSRPLRKTEVVSFIQEYVKL